VDNRADVMDAPATEFAHATWLTDSLLLLVGRRASTGSTRQVAATLETRQGSRRLAAHEFDRLRGQGAPRLLVVVVSSDALHSEEGAVLRIELDRTSAELSGEYVRTLTVAPDEVARESLASLDAAARGEIVYFLASTLTEAPDVERVRMSDRLFQLRQALRERLPDLVNAPDHALGAHIDRLMAVDDRSFFAEGWLRMGQSEVVRLTAISPEGSRIELLDRLARRPRSDVADFYGLTGREAEGGLGFTCYFEMADGCSLRREGWLFEVEDVRGGSWELPAPAVLDDPLAVRHAILSGPHLERPPDEELMVTHIHPAITRIQRRISTPPVVASLTAYGAPPDSPEVSIVVPLYHEIDHLEAQLAEFANDPELGMADLVYVLDSPEQADELLQRAADLYLIYWLPFRIAVLEGNTGFAGACNAGAGVARGRLLLLLNSDILPDRPGWLGTMLAFYDTTPNIGALGPKLMYEDDSIQHAGMYYHQPPGSSLWVDAHYFKGMHRTLPSANVARRVPLVSGACLMTSHDLYSRAGGLPTLYVQGDYEDAHFCLSLIAEGAENWYLPDAELYHLEGQSYGAGVRRPFNRYNMWLHNHLSADSIEELMASFGIDSIGVADVGEARQ
jgi:GT2 family glycosyltransferase